MQQDVAVWLCWSALSPPASCCGWASVKAGGGYPHTLFCTDLSHTSKRVCIGIVYVHRRTTPPHLHLNCSALPPCFLRPFGFELSHGCVVVIRSQRLTQTQSLTAFLIDSVRLWLLVHPLLVYSRCRKYTARFKMKDLCEVSP